MTATFNKISKTGIVWGILGGVYILIFFQIKRALGIPGIGLVAANLIITFLNMIGSVYYYRYRNGKIGFPIARELSFLVFLTSMIILMVARFIDGYFYKFSLPAILFGLALIYGLGRAISFIIGWYTYNLKIEE